LNHLKENGVVVNRAGPKFIGLNPALILENKHADEFLEILRSGVKEI